MKARAAKAEVVTTRRSLRCTPLKSRLSLARSTREAKTRASLVAALVRRATTRKVAKVEMRRRDQTPRRSKILNPAPSARKALRMRLDKTRIKNRSRLAECQ